MDNPPRIEVQSSSSDDEHRAALKGSSSAYLTQSGEWKRTPLERVIGTALATRARACSPREPPEFGTKVPKSPNLSRLMNPEHKDRQTRALAQQEEREKARLALERNSALAPPRTPAAMSGVKLAFELNEDGTVVSLPQRLSELRDAPWLAMEERLAKEFDRVREVSFQLLFGSSEKEKRIGTGLMEEAVFTVAPFDESRVVLIQPEVCIGWEFFSLFLQP